MYWLKRWARNHGGCDDSNADNALERRTAVRYVTNLLEGIGSSVNQRSDISGGLLISARAISAGGRTNSPLQVPRNCYLVYRVQQGHPELDTPRGSFYPIALSYCAGKIADWVSGDFWISGGRCVRLPKLIRKT